MLLRFKFIQCDVAFSSTWNVITNHIASTERIFTVSDLLPATKYQLKVTAHNNAGFTIAIYNFTTLSTQGAGMYTADTE